MFYGSVPPYACAVLIRDYFDQLDDKEKEFCRNIALEYASMPLEEGYNYQVGDGVDAALNVLPLLLKPFPHDSKAIKETLLFTLFDSYPIGTVQRLSDYAVSAILHNLWQESPEDAKSIFWGYLLLKPKFDELCVSIRQENRERNIYDFSNASALERLVVERKSEIAKVVSNQLVDGEIPDISDLDPSTLVTAFSLLPLKTTDESHKRFARKISTVFSKLLRSNR